MMMHGLANFKFGKWYIIRNLTFTYHLLTTTVCFNTMYFLCVMALLQIDYSNS